jgi:hypothetical protein
MYCGFWNTNLTVLFLSVASWTTGIWCTVSSFFILMNTWHTHLLSCNNVKDFCGDRTSDNTYVMPGTRHLPSRNFLCPNIGYQSMYCCLTHYFLVRLFSAKWLAKSSTRLWQSVTFENKHSFCSWNEHVRACTARVKGIDQGWPYIDCHKEVAIVYRKGVGLLLMSFQYCCMWLCGGAAF